MKSIDIEPRGALCFIALLGVIFAASFNHIDTFDVWWHLKTGEIISATGNIPKFDIFSYTATGNEWVNHEWLFQVLAWNIYNYFGAAGLITLKFLITLTIGMTLFRTTEILSRSKIASTLAVAFAVWAIADRIMARPFMFTLLFLTFFMYELHLFVSEDRKRLWLLAPLTVLWINLHGGGLLAPELVIAFAVGETLHLLAERYFGPSEARALGRKKLFHLYIVGLLCLGACLITPYGFRTFTFPLEHLHMDNILCFTQEWLPVFDVKMDHIISMIIARTLVIIIPLSYIIGIRRVRISHLLITILSAFLLLKGRRFSQQFTLINIPIVAYNIWGLNILARIPSGVKRIATWTTVLVMIACSALVLKYGIPASIGHNIPTGDLGIGIRQTAAPMGLVKFLDENDIHGRVFNHMATGGLLINRRWPNDLVFIDGRTPVFGDEFYRDYIMAFQWEPAFNKLDKKYNFDYLVFPAHSAWDSRGFHYYLWRHPAWKLVFAENDSGLIYLRDQEKYRDIIEKKELKSHPIVDMMKRGIKEPSGRP